MQLEQLDQCPWAGPRPLTRESDMQLFVGRKAEASEFISRVKQHRLVILSGDSGVGKSSLVNMKLLPALRKSGYKVIACQDWSGGRDDTVDIDGDDFSSADGFLRRKLGTSVGISVATAGMLGADLDLAYKGRGVIVFDQFEELVRYQPDLFRKVAEWIIQTNNKCSTRIVISLRSEYLHRLRLIEQNATAFSLSSMALDPVAPIEDIRQLIEGASTDADPKPITPQAVDRLLDRWTPEAGFKGNKWHSVGLLHLQATLYALYSRAQDEWTRKGAKARYQVDVKHVLALEAEAKAANQLGVASKTVFDHGLREAVRRKFKLCEDACAKANLDQVLIEGTKAAAYRMMPHLSSGGYKLEREAWGLAELALGRELEQLVPDREASRPSRDDAREAFRELSKLSKLSKFDTSKDGLEAHTDVLSVSRERFLELAPDLGITASKRLEKDIDRGFDHRPWGTQDPDPTHVSAGPMLGFTRGEVLVEELRRVIFAQRWLEAAQLVRESTPDDRTMLSLTHDGFADALEYLVRFRELGTHDALFLLTAAKGRTFDWLPKGNIKDAAPFHPDFDGDRDPITMVNLRWRDCSISADFHRVTFANCDFTGSRFRSCHFRGVTFVNCILDKSSFEECVISGATSDIDPDRSSDSDSGTPSFMIDAAPARRDELLKYRWDQEYKVTSVGRKSIFSRTSGIAALPSLPPHQAKDTYVSERGGLAMYGGRLSSLMIRACQFEDSGKLALRYIAGAALDIVETPNCELDIDVSAIRGLTITRLIDADNPASVSVKVVNSKIANCWFGNNLEGKAVFDNCQVLQLISLSELATFEVSIENCENGGVVNARNPGPKSSMRKVNWGKDAEGRKRVADMFEGMDYVSQPARLLLGDE